MDQSTKTLTMKERLQMQSGESDLPTITHFTTKAILFCVSALVTVACMFLNWLSLDLDLGYLQLHDVLGTVNVFSLPGALGELKESLGILGAFLPAEVMDGIGMAQFASIILMIAAIASIACYVVAVILRIRANDKCVTIGRIAAALAAVTVVGFVVLVAVSLNAMEASAVIGEVLGQIIAGPSVFVLGGALISAICAVMDMGFKEDVIIYHDGRMKIDRGEKWKCRCGRMNLSLLDHCYYCGQEKE